MTLFSVRCLLSAALLAAASLAQAQTAPPAARPDPADSSADVPAVVHRSAFATYRAAGEIEVGSWREANDTVARIGGWRAYAREAAQPDAPASAPADPTRPPPKPGPAPASGHGGHGKH